MDSLLDDVNKLLELEYGDIPRLKQIKKILEEKKMLCIADRKYLHKLTLDTFDKPKPNPSKYDTGDPVRYTADDNLDIEELEEKIKVDEEPS